MTKSTKVDFCLSSTVRHFNLRPSALQMFTSMFKLFERYLYRKSNFEKFYISISTMNYIVSALDTISRNDGIPPSSSSLVET